ncbi:MAG: M1 family aminopeptidase [Anaerolineae bacterium]
MKSRRWSIVLLTLLLALSGCKMLQPPAIQPSSHLAIQPSPTPQPSPATQPSPAIQLPSTPQPSPAIQPSPTIQPSPNQAQAQAMLPDAQGDLATLSDLTRYAIDVTIDYNNLSFKGREVVDFTNTERTPLDRLYFRLFPNGGRSYGNGSLTVSSVTVDGETVGPALSLEDTVLEVRLPAILKRGQSTQLALEFEGTVPRDFGGSGEQSGYGIYNFAEGVMALAGWYPILAVFDDEGWNLDPTSATGDSVYSDAAFYIVNVTTRSDLVLAATGVAVSQQVLDGTTRYRYVSGPARDFFMILSPDFEKATGSLDGIAVNSYYLPGNQAGGQSSLQVAVDAVRTYERRFGPYPYVELDVVDAPMKNAAGVEFPGIVLIGDFLYDNYTNPFFAVATAHEVAHQWWYNVVGNDVIDEPWLDEALTTFSSAVYFQDEKGPGAFQQNLQQWQQGYDQAVEKGQDDLVTRPLRYWDQPEHQAQYGAIVYLKGALFFQAVRDEIGDDAFFKALQTYYQAEKYRIATPDDLLNAFEQAAGRQLDDLYEEWLYSARS